MEHSGADEARRWIVDTLPSFVLLLDREHRLLFLNRVVAGFTVDQVIGTSAFMYVPPEYHEIDPRAWTHWKTPGSARRPGRDGVTDEASPGRRPAAPESGG